MSAALLSLGERAAQGLGRGELSQVYIEGDAGTVFLISADDEAVLVAVQDGIGKGSGRSISAFDLHGALSDCATHFQRFGGHRAAAGLTMDAAQLPAFTERFDEVARARLTAEDLIPELRVDLEVPIESPSSRTRPRCRMPARSTRPGPRPTHRSPAPRPPCRPPPGPDPAVIHPDLTGPP